MRASNVIGGLFAGALVVAALVGCSSKTEPAASPPASQEHHEGDGHDHSDKHSDIGPHGGHLIELGEEEYHAELLHDEATHRVTIYILDGRAKENVPISLPELSMNILVAGSPRQFKLLAVSQANEASDLASCFQAEDEELCDALCESDSKGRLNVSINGKPFVGEIAGHGHEHGHDQADQRNHSHE